jgi:HK97 family phage portal protein
MAIKNYIAGLNDAYFASTSEAVRSGNLTIAGGLSAMKARDLVPWAFRAVEKRSLLVASVPYILESRTGQDVTDDPAYASFMGDLRDNLKVVEGAKCLTGAGYLYLDANEIGRNIAFRWLRSPFIKPVIETNKGITGWRCEDYYQPDVPRIIAPERVIHFWNVNYASSTAPGAGEVEVALGAASMLYALDAFTAGFFNSGGVKITVFEVPQSMNEGDKQAFQNFLNRAMSGIRNAFKNIAVRAGPEGIKPTVIGSSIKETLAPELVLQQRDNIAVAIGIPPAIIDGKSRDDSNSRSEVLNMYLDTIIPEFDVLADTLNKQFFSQYGLKLRSTPETMEVLQNAQLAQVQALTLATGGPILTTDEGRALLGKGPMAEQQALEGTDNTDDENGTPEGEPVTDVISAGIAPKGMKTWRESALSAVKAGRNPADVSVPVDVPYGLVQAIDAELKTARSARQVRSIFARHWPHESMELDPVLELKRYNDLQERQRD